MEATDEGTGDSIGAGDGNGAGNGNGAGAGTGAATRAARSGTGAGSGTGTGTIAGGTPDNRAGTRPVGGVRGEGRAGDSGLQYYTKTLFACKKIIIF